MQTHEPKMKVAPLGGVMVLKAKVAIELADELAESPQLQGECRIGTEDRQCWQLLEGYRVVLRVYDPGKT